MIRTYTDLKPYIAIGATAVAWAKWWTMGFPDMLSIVEPNKSISNFKLLVALAIPTIACALILFVHRRAQRLANQSFNDMVSVLMWGLLMASLMLYLDSGLASALTIGISLLSAAMLFWRPRTSSSA